MRLIADCGNTCVKLALYDAGRMTAYARLQPQMQSLDAWIGLHHAQASELVLLPGAAATAGLVEGWWADNGGGRPLRVIGGDGELDLPVPDLGQYPGCGMDRVLAGFCAGTSERQSVVVVDVGTATTLTAWLVRPDLPDPVAAIRFAGGLILPGMRACLTGLVAKAPALPLVEPLGPDASARQRDTAGAIAAAIGIGYGPMVAACLLKLQRETNIHHEVVTGGDADQLMTARLAHAKALRPTLVLDGIDSWCRRCDH
jgi:pantothenate kinase type III